MDGILVKSSRATDLIIDLEETLSKLNRYGLKLNHNKCVFGVRSGKFLGYLVTERGLETKPKKVRALQNMKTPQSTWEVQRLVGRIIALSHFIPRFADRSLPFFKVLRDEKCDLTIVDLKKYLEGLPILYKLVARKRLWIYLMVGEGAVS